MALRMKARLVLVVEPLGPAVTVLKGEESKVILMAFLVIVSSCLPWLGPSDCNGSTCSGYGSISDAMEVSLGCSVS